MTVPVPYQKISVAVIASKVDAVEAALMEFGAIALTLSADNEQQPSVYHIANPSTTADLWPKVLVTGLFDVIVDSTSLQTTLERQLGIHADNITIDKLEQRNWMEHWKQHVKHQCYAERLWVSPVDHPVAQAHQAEVLIDPGMAFGTGLHASTQLCLQWLAQHDLNQHNVMDYGCGSGILAIAALKLGATQAYGVDIDPTALQVAADNARINGVLHKLILQSPTAITATDFQLVLANILAGPLQSLATKLAELTGVEGTLILAGILPSQVDAVWSAYETWFQKVQVTTHEGWSRIVLERNQVMI